MGSEQQAALTQKSLAISGNAACVKCGYSLAGLPHSGACPECATAVAKSVGPLMAFGEMVTIKAACIRCGYSLTGLPVAGKCPECGSLVEDSLRGNQLQFVEKAVIKKLLSGTSLILNGILALIIVAVGTKLLSVLFGAAVIGVASQRPVLTLSANLLSAVLYVMITIGYWRFTELDETSLNIDQERSARNLVRRVALAHAALALLSIVVSTIAVYLNTLSEAMIFVALGSLVVQSLWLLGFAALMAVVSRYVLLLAVRVPDAKLITTATRYAWLLPVLSTVGIILFFLGPIFALIRYWNMLDRVRKHLKAILAGEFRATLRGVNVPLA